MTAQQLLDELLELQKQGFDLDKLDVWVVEDFESYPIRECQIDFDGLSFNIWGKDETQRN
jgi:hypothetical protein